MHHGLHAPNRPFTPGDLERFAMSGASSCKLMVTDGTQHTAQDVINLRMHGCKYFTGRMPSSRLDDGRVLGVAEYADKCIARADPLIRAGVYWWEWDTEPNWLWATAGFGPWAYQAFMRDVMQRLAPWVEDRRVRTIAPPLSFSPALWKPHHPVTNKDNPGPWTLDHWHEAYNFHDHPHAKEPLWHYFDACGATVYWQSPRQMLDPSYGASYATVHEWFGHRPVVVTEYGVDPQEGIDRERAQLTMYPEWLAKARAAGYVAGAFLYIIGSTADWLRFVPTDKVLMRLRESV